MDLGTIFFLVMDLVSDGVNEDVEFSFDSACCCCCFLRCSRCCRCWASVSFNCCLAKACRCWTSRVIVSCCRCSSCCCSSLSREAFILRRVGE